MTTATPEENNNKKWNWTLPANIPLSTHLAHRIVCDAVDNCSDCEELRKMVKSYHALFKITQHQFTLMAKQDFGFPTNMDGV